MVLLLPVWLVIWYGVHLAPFYDWALRDAWPLTLEHLLLVVAGLAIAGVESLIAQAKPAEKSDQTQRVEAQATIALVDDLATGKPAAATLPIKWEHQDYIKAQADKTYVPFTIAISRSTCLSNV